MATIVFTQNLRRHVDIERVEVRGATVADALGEVFDAHPRLRGYLVDDTGAVRRHVAILVDGVTIADRRAQSDSLAPDATVFVVQALSGG